ncbi:MAG: ABC transporter ATP-binding protein [Ignavibacteria bacterium]|nr:ABC transporter ATP-binding protein [Bacteroidota bacterium]MSQ45554.1 ABC transporter ATP-binding protein [Ignavibacteria bacterium]
MSMQDDEILGKAYDSNLMMRLIRYLRPYKWQVIGAIFLSMVVALLESVRPFFTKIAVDDNIAKGDKEGLLYTTMLFFAVLMIRGVMQFFNAYLTQWIGQKTIYDLRIEIYRHLQYRSLRFFDKNPIGRLITRVTNDVEVLNEMFSSGIVMVFSDVFMIIGIVWLMFSMNWKLALISLSVLPFLFYGTFLFRKKAREAYREVRLQVAKINTFMQEHISGMLVDQIFNRQKKSFKKFENINGAHRDANIKSIFYYALFYPSVDIIGSVVVGLIIWYSANGIIEGTVTIGTIMAFLQFNEMFWRPIRDLSEKYNIMQTAMASSERIFKLLDDKTAIIDSENPVSLNKTKGKIEFKNVWFAYNDEEWILKNISFTIFPGETIAIVGHTGAGKTTIINLLNRMYDIQKGEILIDGINIKNVSQVDLRKNIGLVMQDVFLFSGDVKTNIDLGNEEISIDKVKHSAEMVGVKKFIDSLQGGFSGEVKERGSTFSVGQKQLISFARTLAYNPQILVLDEATSSVDTETEILIQQAIIKLLQDRTSIVIAHRLSTIQRADKIIVMHKGEIRESGNHQELLAVGGIYQKLYQLQYKEQEKAALN